MPDPWADVTTSSGMPADEVISALQKSIRRGDVENAVVCARDLALTSPELEDFLWLRLRVIAVEDVGSGRPDAPVLVSALDSTRQLCEPGHDRLLMAVHAARTLAEAPKDRSTDELANWIRIEVDEHGRRPRVADFAVDMHTRRGQALGRGLEHFLLEGAVVEHEVPDRNRTWRMRLFEALGVEPPA